VTETRHGRWRGRAALAIAAAAVLLVVVSHPLWLRALGHWLVVNDPLQVADAIVVLGGGGPDRVAGGVALFEAGYAPWLVVTNMPLNTPGIREDYAELMRREAVWQGVPEERILRAPGTVRTTYEEALVARQLCSAESFRSLIVVSDLYHTRRVRRAFGDALAGSGIHVMVRASQYSGWQPDDWWRTMDGLRDTWTEYLKWVLYALGYR
jgi:uncharacterized SAM-binding protein YcdF (DUF218 family)